MKQYIVLFICLSLFNILPSTAQNDDQESYIQCEDTCRHVHGIDLSHYQGEVFWENVGANSKMAYVYLKATEGSTHIDETYERNIELAHRYGLKVGSYHFFRPKTDLAKQLENFISQCRPGDQDLIPMIDIESTGGLKTDEFCDSLFKFLDLVEKAYRQKPLLYTYTNFYNKHLKGKIDDYKLMIAQYSDENRNWLTTGTTQCGNTRLKDVSTELTHTLTKAVSWAGTA